jgi:hypothetical protein
MQYRFRLIFGNNGLSENKPKESLERFIFRMKPFFDPWILDYSAHFLYYLNRGNQFELLVYPEILKLGRERILSKETADKKVGIYHSP